MAETKFDRPTYTSDFIKSDTDKAVFLGNVLFDNMMTSMIALGSEVWANRRRMKVIEALLEKKGSVTAEMIETYMPTKEEEAAWQAERDQFIKAAFGALAREGSELTLTSDWRD